MKRFIRTVAGKTTLFIVCVLSVCILAASVLGVALILNDTGDYFYTHTAEEVKYEFVGRHFLDRGYDWVNLALSDDRTDDMGSVMDKYIYLAPNGKYYFKKYVRKIICTEMYRCDTITSESEIIHRVEVVWKN